MQSLDIVKKFIDTLKEERINIDAAYLFGSHAKGKTWEGSDIDVCIVADYADQDFADLKKTINHTAIKIDARLEPVVFTPKEFGNKYDALAAEIKQYGILVN